VHFTWQVRPLEVQYLDDGFHVQLRQDLSLSLLFSTEDIHHFREGIAPDDVSPSEPRKLWVCLEMILENFRQLSSIQQVTHDDHSQVEFGNMTMYVTIDLISTFLILLFSALPRQMTAVDFGYCFQLRKRSPQNLA
jgi:hypothetical protein